MKQSKRKSYKPHSRSHTTKTPAEREAYDEKVKLTTPEGETNIDLPTKSSTLSAQSVYGSMQTAGTPDRNAINPPKAVDKKWTAEKIIGIVVSILAIIGVIVIVIVGVVVWITTLKNRVDFNEMEISQLDKSVEEVDLKQEDLNTRIIKLEQWKNVFAEELKKIEQDLKNGISPEQIEIQLMELERRIFDQMEKNYQKKDQ